MDDFVFCLLIVICVIFVTLIHKFTSLTAKLSGPGNLKDDQPPEVHPIAKYHIPCPALPSIIVPEPDKDLTNPPQPLPLQVIEIGAYPVAC